MRNIKGKQKHSFVQSEAARWPVEQTREERQGAMNMYGREDKDEEGG